MSSSSVSASSLNEPASSENADPEKDEQHTPAVPSDPTPEAPSEAGRLCDPFLDRFAGMMNHGDISGVINEQAHMLTVFEVANEKLASLNRISELNYFNTSVELRQTTRSLVAMKKELDSIFRRIRSLKSQVASQYPEAYSKAVEYQSMVGNSDD